MWSIYFIEVKGYMVEELELHQDNMSSMLVEKNNKDSSRKSKDHILVRYFFIKNHIENGDVLLE